MMNEAYEHTAGSASFSVHQIQAIHEDPLFDGVRYTFSVEPAGDQGAFEVVIEYAPIFIAMIPLVERAQLASAATELVCTTIDTGVRESVTVDVTSDGVAMLHARAIAEGLTGGPSA